MSDFATIYTDASWRGRDSGSGYGYYAKTSGLTMKGGGLIAGDVPSVNIAEMLAIVAAVHEVQSRVPHVVGYFINTDSFTCCNVLWPWKSTDHYREKAMLSLARDLEALVGGRWIRVKHVKGHTGRKDVRSFCNDYADKLAKVAPPLAAKP